MFSRLSTKCRLESHLFALKKEGDRLQFLIQREVPANKEAVDPRLCASIASMLYFLFQLNSVSQLLLHNFGVEYFQSSWQKRCVLS